MDKIKLKKRSWTNKDGSKGSAYRFFYSENGEKKYIQSPNRKYLEGEAKRILFRLDNVKSEYPLPLEDTWEAYYKQQKTRMYEKNRKFSQTTLNEYECHYKNILSICGNVDLRGITEDYIGKFLLKLKPKYVDHKLVSGFAKMNYRKKLFDTFARIYNYHVGYGKPFKSNIFKIGSYFSDQDKRDMKYVPLGQNLSEDWLEEWDFDRIKSIIDNVESADVRLMFKLMAETSCRPSEARAAQRSSFNFLKNTPMFKIFHAVDNYKYLVPPKTDKGYRSIVISSDLKDQLTDHINKMPKNQEFLFLNSVGRFYDLSVMTDQLNKTLKILKLKLPFRKNYFFRHWNASMWAYSGKYTNAMDLAKDMGDKDINMIDEKYIKRYGSNKNSERFTEHQNNYYKWN